MPNRAGTRQRLQAVAKQNSQNQQYVGEVVDANAAGGIIMVRMGGQIIRCAVPAGSNLKYGEKITMVRLPGSPMLVAQTAPSGGITQIIMAGGATAAAPAAQPTLIPATPIDLTATAISSSENHLEWSSTGENTDIFGIERSSDGGNFTEIAQVPVYQTAYTDEGLTPATRYWYRVRAMNNG